MSHPQAASDATNTVERKHEKRLKVVMGLQSVIAPGYRDEAKGDSVLEIREVDESVVQGTLLALTCFFPIEGLTFSVFTQKLNHNRRLAEGLWLAPCQAVGLQRLNRDKRKNPRANLGWIR